MSVDAPGPDGTPIRIDPELLGPHRAALAAGDASDPVRAVFAATHVVMRAGYRDVAHGLEHPGGSEEIGDWIDWDATLGLRRRLDGLGFGIAEAMDTAQRFFLGWSNAERLVRACGKLQLDHGFIAGAGVDHLDRVDNRTQLVDGVVAQARVIQEAGGWVILLPMPWLTDNGVDEEGYVEVYRAIVQQLEGPLFVHWLGPMFLPELDGYFPGDSFRRVMAVDPAKVRGAKLSLFDDRLECDLRADLLTRDQILLTGDDFHFARLILGGDSTDRAARAAPVERSVAIGDRQVAVGDFSHALLGAFDGVAEPAGLALRLLAQGEVERYLEIMAPCEALAREVFAEPTRHYKAGLAFLAWLNGLQDNFMLVNHEQRARDRAHYLRVAELAAAAGALSRPALAAERLQALLEGRHHE